MVRRVHCAFRRLIRLSSRSATRGLSFLARTDHGAHPSEAVKQESYRPIKIEFEPRSQLTALCF